MAQKKKAAKSSTVNPVSGSAEANAATQTRINDLDQILDENISLSMNFAVDLPNETFKATWQQLMTYINLNTTPAAENTSFDPTTFSTFFPGVDPAPDTVQSVIDYYANNVSKAVLVEGDQDISGSKDFKSQLNVNSAVNVYGEAGSNKHYWFKTPDGQEVALIYSDASDNLRFRCNGGLSQFDGDIGATGLARDWACEGYFYWTDFDDRTRISGLRMFVRDGVLFVGSNTGNTVSPQISIPNDPTDANHLARKAYVDGKLPTSQGASQNKEVYFNGTSNMKIQCGKSAAIPPNSSLTITFDQAFSAVYSAQLTVQASLSPSDAYATVGSVSNTQLVINNHTAGDQIVHWLVIGAHH